MEDFLVSEIIKIKSHKGIYTVELDDLNSDQFSEWNKDKTHFIVDSKVAQLYPTLLKQVLLAPSVLLLEALEKNKSVEKLPDYIEFLVDNKIRRNHVLVAIGGGIIQDITSFISATILRGVEWVFYPTTLLSQADSCIGSKSSINCRGAKNIMGTFTPPKKIYLSTNFLNTLNKSELKSGVGEMLKVHAIAGLNDFKSIASDYNELFIKNEKMQYRIKRSLEIKKAYIEKDEFDQNHRLIFNYGHSFGHAIESATNYKIPHGIAVSIGCDMANYCAYRLGVSNKDIWRSMSPTFKENYEGYEKVEIPFDPFLSALGKDKKNEDINSFSLIFPDNEGNIFKDIYPNNSKLRKIFLEFLTTLKVK